MSNLKIGKVVQEALEKGLPVVALESTIISHGMPYPQNVETALAVEELVRQMGAVPATCGVVDGVLTAGLTKEEIEQFGKIGKNINKVSRRDLPFSVAKKESGATTVASTMIIAHKAGIKVFATGGIGGVHRGAETTFDISADIDELAKTPVLVVCAGPKAILDLDKTLEALETRGVPVVGYQSDCLPAFYTRTSNLKVPIRCDSAKEIADAFHQSNELGFPGGMLVANPIPEQYSLDGDKMEAIILDALKKADKLGIKGKEITPFLLEEITNQTGGESLESNIQLVFNNVKLACEIAKGLTK